MTAAWILILFLLGFFLVLGPYLILTGWRGRRIDRHPVCRRCRFDLSGSPDAVEAKSPCPECGTLGWPRIGNRQRKPARVWAGTGLLLAVAAVVGLGTYAGYDAARMTPYKSIVWLRWEAKLGGANLAGAALDELARRVEHGRVSGATLKTLFADVVTYGPAGNPRLVNAAVGSDWDALAAELMLAGAGTDAEKRAVIDSWYLSVVEARPKVRVGEDVPVRFRYENFGPPPNPRYNFWVDRAEVKVFFGEDAFSSGVGGGSDLSGTRNSGSSSGWMGTRLSAGQGMPENLRPGHHAFEYEIEFTLRIGSQGPALATWTSRYPGAFEYVDASGDPITLLRDNVAAAAIEAGTSITNNQIEVTRSGSNIVINLKEVSAPVAYRIDLQRGEQRWAYTTISADVTGGYGFGTSGDVPEELEDGAIVDLVFEPDPDVARQTADLTTILDHGFTLRGVKIVRP